MEEEIWTPSSEIPDGKCTICRIDIQGHGNNPSPVKNEGRCCDTCNTLVVLPHRLRASGMTEEEVESYLESILKKEKKKGARTDRLSLHDVNRVKRPEEYHQPWISKKYDPRDTTGYYDPSRK